MRLPAHPERMKKRLIGNTGTQANSSLLPRGEGQGEGESWFIPRIFIEGPDSAHRFHGFRPLLPLRWVRERADHHGRSGRGGGALRLRCLRDAAEYPARRHYQRPQVQWRTVGRRERYTFLRARYYDQTLGRFISRDAYPINPKIPQTINRYLYTLNNPLGLTDPSGNCPICVSIAVGAILGGGVELVEQLLENGGNLGAVNWADVAIDAAAEGMAGGTWFRSWPRG